MIYQVIGQPLQMLVKQRETQRQIQNAETEKQLQQALSQVTDISKALEEIRLCYQNQVSVSVYLRMITLQILCWRQAVVMIMWVANV